ncbi:PAS domain-containing protein [Nodosilinea sp. PGN35]|uniref:PAS domain-containing protein n=1 Tax=Nodosilinea sp. PGN35 TaxID=3020489 RepID=UPI0023B2567A|nr:PAS domain-containing protein [Nodosilinea sp. TSF1-S3]MDF0369596.1 PAS domain-containing protein [Nodosilinea sp. TSF1-S3]
MFPSSPSVDRDRLNNIARHIPGVIYEFVQYPDGRLAFPYISTGLLDLCGIPPEAVREDAEPFFAVVHPDDRAGLAQSIQSSAAQLTSWSCEYRFYHPDGQLRWLQGHAAPQREADGLVHWYGCIQDVTSQKNNRLALEASEHKLRRLIDAINGLVLTIAPDGTLSFLSSTTTSLTGYDLDELLHRPYADFIYPDDRVRCSEAVQNCLGGVSCRSLELRALHRDGHYYWYSISLLPFAAKPGAAVSCLGIATYIDDRKQAELARQESDARYQVLVANVPGMVYRYLPDAAGGAFTCVSAGCYELFGLDPDQLLRDANTVWNLIHPDDLPSLQTSVAQAVAHRTDWAWEGRFTTATGQQRWLQGRSRPQVTTAGLVWDGLMIDITALKQTEAALSQEVSYRRALVESSVDGIVTLDPAGNVLEANTSFATMLGYSLDETTALNVADFDVSPGAIGDQGEIFGLGQNRFERRHRRRDGSTYAVEISASPVLWNGQSVYLCVCRDIEERQRAEMALAASEARFQQLAAASPAVIYTVVETAAGIVRFDYISPAAEEIHEIPVATLMQNGALISGQMHPEDRERYSAAYADSLRTMAPFFCEWRIVTPSGKTKWLKANSRPERRPNGDVAWHGIAVDKTTQKQAELDVASLQTALLEAQHIARIGNWAFDLASQTITWSPELFRMFGLDPAAGEPAYDDYLQMIHPDDRSQLVRAVNQAAAQGTPYQIDYRALLPDGSIRYHEGRGGVGRDETGKVARLFGTCLDITDRKQSEMALQTSQMRLELALDSSGTGTWDWNMQTNQVVFSQKHWKAFVGYGADETPADTVAEWESRVHPDDRLQLGTDIAKHLLGETEIYENVHRLRCQDGTYKWNLAQGKIVEWDEHHKPLRFVGVNRDITERKLTEIALADLREKLEKAQEISHLGYWSFDLKTRKISWSDEVFRIFGMSPEQDEPTFSEHLEQFHPGDQPLFLERLAEAHQGIPQNFDFRIFRPDGEMRYVNGRIELEYREERIVRMFGVAMDITDRKQSELALRASEGRFRAIFEQAAAGINQIDASGRFVEANQYYCNLLGYTKDELLKLTFVDVIHPEDLARHRPQIDRIVGGEIDYLDYEKRDRHRNGDWIWTKISISVLRDEAGQVAGNLAVVVDIGDRKRAEHIVRQQAMRETLLREITQRIRQSLDLPTIFSTACQEICACCHADRVGIFKFDPDSGHSDGEFVAEFSADGLPSVLAMRVSDRCFGANYANRYTQGDYFVIDDIYSGTMSDCHIQILAQFQVRASLVLPLLCGDNLWGLLCIHQCSGPRQWLQSDLDLGHQLANQLAIAIQQVATFERLQQELGERQLVQQQLSDRNQKLAIANQKLAIANRELSHATRLKDEFLANMSHELRTPLNVILGFAQLLSADSSLQAQQREYIRIMQRSGDHLLHLINDILDLSKIEASRITLEPASIDLFSLLYDLQSMFQERAEDKDLYFTLALTPDLPQYIVADPNRLRQVLINLLGNAVKFTQGGGVTLRVSLQAPGEPDPRPDAEAGAASAQLAFAVADTGTGIAPDELTAIFDAFIQARAGKVSLEGTGLGLAISRSLVQLMGGALTVESTLGEGSTFQFTLPLRLAKAEDVVAVDSLDSVVGLAPEQPTYRILVVDDQSENRCFLVAALSQLGLAVQEAGSGADAIARWRQWHPHLIWMDLRMPDLDGCEVTRRIRAEAQERGDGFGPVIIALTAQASREQRDQALAAGCDDFVSKPVQLNLLLTKMADHLGLRYRYADQEPEPLSGGRLEASALQVMPPDWIRALHRASVLCDGSEAAQLIQQISPEHRALIDGLTQLLRDFKFEVLMQLTQAWASSGPWSAPGPQRSQSHA